MLAKIQIPEGHLSYTLECLDKNSALFSHTNVPWVKQNLLSGNLHFCNDWNWNRNLETIS